MLKQFKVSFTLYETKSQMSSIGRMETIVNAQTQGQVYSIMDAQYNGCAGNLIINEVH